MNDTEEFALLMQKYGADLTPEDKDLLLRLAAQMAETNRTIRDAEAKKTAEGR